MNNFPRYAAAVAVFAAVLYAAVVIAVFGMISLVINRDVISDSSVGSVVGPVMTGACVLAVFGVYLAIALGVSEDRQRISIGLALLVGFGAYFLFGLLGGVLVALASADPFGFVTFLASQLVSPFAIAIGVLAFIITVLYMLVLASKVGNKGRPRWPWEPRDR